MSKLFRRVRGFTLIELLVVIAIIAILAAILTPAVTAALLRARVNDMSTRARSMYQSIFAKQTEDVYGGGGLVYPVKSNAVNGIYGAFPDSTEYFKWMVTNNVMNVSFTFFAGPSMVSAKGKDPTSFKEENNAWCVSGSMTERSPEDAPFIFTRNLQVDILGQTPVVDASGPMLARTPDTQLPFGTRAFAFVTKGGSAYALQGDSLKAEQFTNLFVVAGITNPVLRPTP
jgi:prepilin-type N-terminal cleavage/methylation domain-containing protein